MKTETIEWFDLNEATPDDNEHIQVVIEAQAFDRDDELIWLPQVIPSATLWKDDDGWCWWIADANGEALENNPNAIIEDKILLWARIAKGPQS